MAAHSGRDFAIDPHTDDDIEQTLAERVGALVAWPIALALLGGAILVIAELVPGHVSAGRNPDFLDNIFASAALIAAIRIALIFLAGYVVISVVALIIRRQWLVGLGPVQISEPVNELTEANQMLQAYLEEAGTRIANLEAALDATDEELEFYRQAWRNMPQQEEGRGNEPPAI